MVDTAHKIVSTLLELNVLNIQHIERELRNIAVRAIYPQANKWIMTVARNYIVNLEGQEMDSEYQKYTPKRPKKGIHTDMPEPGELPDWAQKAVGGGQAIHFFDPAQPRQRSLWQSVENILDWFNTWRADDPSLNRLDRVSFPKARELATAWRNEIESNPWLHIKDRPPVYKTYPDGMKWVKMHDVHLKREGELMGHCLIAKVITKNGTFPLGDLVGKKVEVLTRTSKMSSGWIEAEIKSFGMQPIWEVVLSRHQSEMTIFATGGHRWFAFNNTKNKQHLRLFEKTTETLEPGNRLPSVYAKRIQFKSETPKGVSLSAIGVMHGVIFGDGHADAAVEGKSLRSGKCVLYGAKDFELLEWFPSKTRQKSVDRSIGGIEINDMPRFFKKLPPINEAPSYLIGWLAGYFAADGNVTVDGQSWLCSANRSNLEFAEMLCQRFGIRTTGIRSQPRIGYGDEASLSHRLVIEVGALPEDFYLLASHRARVKERDIEAEKWTVKSVKLTNRIEEVFCAQVPKTQCFAIEGNILTGNCIGSGGYSNRGGTREYYSLRDEKNEPHISVEVSVNGDQRSVLQMKGKGNAKPVARYQSYLRDLVTQPGWTVTGDRGYLDPAPIGR